MAVPTSSSSAPPRRTNLAAQLALALGVLAAAVVPALVVGSRYLPHVHLLDAVFASVPAAIVFGLGSVLAARRARRRLSLTLGRSGGERTARIGRALALVGLYLGCTGAIALGFYAVLRAYS